MDKHLSRGINMLIMMNNKYEMIGIVLYINMPGEAYFVYHKTCYFEKNAFEGKNHFFVLILIEIIKKCLKYIY
jgi:CYTH domain-containing protein